MLRVIHTADTHIGYRQYHADERRHDFLRAFEQVIDDAIDAEVDAVVHAGDLFHDKRPDLRDLQGTIAALARLNAAGIPFLGIVGNHERKRDTQWLDLFADLELAERLGTEPTVIDGLACYGIDYRPPTARSSDAPAFEPADGVDAAVLVGHGIVKGLPYGDWDLDQLLDAAGVEFDAVLLGDYHEHELERRDGVVVTYPGSTERASATERAPRGYNLVTVDDDEVSVSHRALVDTRPFVYVDVDLADGEGDGRVIDRLDEFDLEAAVVIVTVEGDGGAVSPAVIETHARDRGALVARVRDSRTSEGGTADGDVAVHFADPDRAVREALAGTDLSEATHELDGLIRDRGVADSRVRERTRSLVASLLDDDPDALDRPGSAPDEAPIAEPVERTEDDEPTVDEHPEPPEEQTEAVAAADDQSSMGDFQ